MVVVINRTGQKNRIALCPRLRHNFGMLAKVCSAAVNGIEAYPVEVEVNPGPDMGFLDSRDIQAPQLSVFG